MNSSKNYRDKLLNDLKTIKGFETYYNLELRPLSFSSQANNMRSLKKFLFFIEKDVSEINKTDVENYLISEKFSNLSNSSKNQYLIYIKKYLRYYKRKELVDCFKNYRVKNNELNTNELINRDDLVKIIKTADAKRRAMIMVSYEAALRRAETLGIRVKDVDLKTGNLYIRTSKSKGRNIPIKDSIPYIQEYISMNILNPEDKLFDFSINSLTGIYYHIGEKAELNKKLYPHLLRHSRLTELAKTKVNEPQLRKFAGWTKRSPMSDRYVHLNDEDLKDIIFGSPIQRKKEEFESSPSVLLQENKKLKKEIEDIKSDIKLLYYQLQAPNPDVQFLPTWLAKETSIPIKKKKEKKKD